MCPNIGFSKKKESIHNPTVMTKQAMLIRYFVYGIRSSKEDKASLGARTHDISYLTKPKRKLTIHA